MSADPYQVQTYCGCCHAAKTHFLRTEFTDAKRICYECATCLHLVFAPRLRRDGE